MKLLTLAFLILLLSLNAAAQKYIIVDSYGTKRWKIDVGEEIKFKTIDSKYKNVDVIKELQDSLVLFQESGAYVHISEFEKIYKPRPLVQGISAGAYFPATGFLFSGLIAYPLMKNPGYSQSDAIFLGLGFLALSQVLRPLSYKKYNIKKRSRIRIIDVSFK